MADACRRPVGRWPTQACLSEDVPDDSMSNHINTAAPGSLYRRPAGTGNPDWANADGSFGESLGIGYQIPTGRWGIAEALGLPDAGCEFGARGGLPDGFQAQAAAPVIAAPICAIAEPCGAIVLGAAIAITGIEAGVAGYQIYQRGRTNVADTGITSEAQQLIAQGLSQNDV